MSQLSLEHALKNLHRVGTLVKDRGYRQLWRFEYEGRGYYLKFYPRLGIRDRLRRLFRGNPAMREFVRLQWLQKARIPAPRAVATLVGFAIEGRLGDAVILEAIEPSTPLDRHLTELALQGRRAENHRELAAQIRSLLQQLGTAKLGHIDLHLGNFLLSEGKLYLLDAYAVRRGGLRMRDVQLLAHSARPYATRTDLQRAWDLIGPGGSLPQQNSIDKRQWRRSLRRIVKEDRYFGKLRLGQWRGHYFKQARYPLRWSVFSKLQIDAREWEQAWPMLLNQIESDQMTVIKRSPSGDVLEGEVILGGRPLAVIIKRPRRKLWHRFIVEIFRAGRARRAWHKAWQLVVREIPTAWPVLLMEKRKLGYLIDSIIVFEKVPAKSLNWIDLNEMSRSQRDVLFHRMGRLLRRMEMDGLSHRDTKSSNWMIVHDDKLGLFPMLIDVDGLYPRRFSGKAMFRLLESMRHHPSYDPDDSLALCIGYAPTAPILREEQPTSKENNETHEAESKN